MKNTRRACRRWLQALAIAGVLLSADAQGQAPAEMFEQTTYSVGSGPQGLVASDIDGDGDVDLAVANRFSNSITVRRNQGDGSFPGFSTLGVGSQPLAVAAGDLDGDGDIDLASVNSGNSSVSRLYALGGGFFSPAQHVGVSAQPRDVAAGDLDGDGAADLVVAHDSMSASLSLLRSSGSSAPSVVASGFRAGAVVVADLDGDGLLDLVVNDASFHQVRTYRGLGGGALAPAAQWPVQLDPRDVAVVDADGDGMLDIVAACLAPSRACLLLGSGDGSFVPGGDFATGLQPQQVAAGDVDADGIPDLLTTNFGGGDVSLLLGDGAGAFGPPLALQAGVLPAGIVVADTSGDGLLDVAVSNSFSNSVSVFTSLSEPPLPPWVDVGGGVVGRMGPVALQVEGLPVAGQPVAITVVADRHTPPAWLFLGQEEQALPFKGGLLVPVPEERLHVRTNVPLVLVWPDLPVGETLTLQAWIQPQAAEGVVSASNALRGTTQAP